MLDKLADALFGCLHNHRSFPFTMRSPETGKRTDTYVVCLDCGAELPYDWERMKLKSACSRAGSSRVLQDEKKAA